MSIHNSNIDGRWTTEDENSDTEFIIDVIDGVPNVVAMCISDGELLAVSNLRWEEGSLKFETTVPSTGDVAFHTMRFTSPDVCEHELTIWETLRRFFE